MTAGPLMKFEDKATSIGGVIWACFLKNVESIIPGHFKRLIPNREIESSQKNQGDPQEKKRALRAHVRWM